MCLYKAMQTAARQLITGWNTQAGVSRITWCDFHRPISHGDTHKHTRTYRQGDVRRGGALSPEARVSDIIEDASPWKHCQSLDSIQNSDTAFSQVRTNAGKREADTGERKRLRRRATCSFFSLCHLRSSFAPLTQTYTQNQMIPVITFLICLLNAC